MIDRLPQDALVLADSGFGIFRVAQHCQSRDKEFVFRLTASRFKSLRKKATQVADEAGCRTWYLVRRPSAKDRKNNPHLPGDAMVEVFVHQIELAGEKDLYLVSNVDLVSS